MLPGMVQEFVHTSGSLLQAWQLLSSCSAVLVFCVVAGGLIWRVRTEARVIETVHDDGTPPVLQRLNTDSTSELEPNASKAATLARFTKPVAPSRSPLANGD